MGVSSIGSGSTVITQTDTSNAAIVDSTPVDTSAQSSFQGPTGSVKLGDASYEVKGGQVSLNGKTIGTVGDDGNFQVTIGGKSVAGNVGDLIGASVAGTLSTGAKVDNRVSGDVEVGGSTFTVNQGEVSQGGVKVGTVNAKGDFDVTLDGRHEQGNVTQVQGAVYTAKIAGSDRELTNKVSGEVTVGDQQFSVKNGEVSQGGVKVGTVNAKGEYDVTLNGQRQQGNVTQVPGAIYTAKAAGSDQLFSNTVSGEVTVGDQKFQVTDGQVSQGGKVVGTINDHGDYNVNLGGKAMVGSLRDLSGVSVTIDGRTYTDLKPPGSGPYGQVQYGGKVFSVENGEVFQLTVSGAMAPPLKVGTLQADGTFTVKLDGVTTSGKLDELEAVYAQWGKDGPKGPVAQLLTPTTAMTTKIANDREAQGLLPGEDIDAFGNKIRWHVDAKTGERDGYQVLETAPGNINSSGATVVEQSVNSMYPEKNFRRFSDGTTQWWDGKVPSLPVPSTRPGETVDTIDVSRFKSADELASTLRYYLKRDFPEGEGNLPGSRASAANQKVEQTIATFSRYDFNTQYAQIKAGVSQVDLSSPSMRDGINQIDQQLINKFFDNQRTITNDLASGTITPARAAELTKANEAAHSAANVNLRGMESQAFAKQILDVDTLSPDQRSALGRFEAAIGQYGGKINFADPNGARFAQRALDSRIADTTAFAASLASQAQFVDRTFQAKLGRLPTTDERVAAMFMTPEKDLNDTLWARRAADLTSGAYFSSIGWKKAHHS